MRCLGGYLCLLVSKIQLTMDMCICMNFPLNPCLCAGMVCDRIGVINTAFWFCFFTTHRADEQFWVIKFISKLFIYAIGIVVPESGMAAYKVFFGRQIQESWWLNRGWCKQSFKMFWQRLGIILQLLWEVLLYGWPLSSIDV